MAVRVPIGVFLVGYSRWRRRRLVAALIRPPQRSNPSQAKSTIVPEQREIQCQERRCVFLYRDAQIATGKKKRRAKRKKQKKKLARTGREQTTPQAVLKQTGPKSSPTTANNGLLLSKKKKGSMKQKSLAQQEKDDAAAGLDRVLGIGSQSRNKQEKKKTLMGSSPPSSQKRELVSHAKSASRQRFTRGK